MANETLKIGCFGKLPFYSEYIDRRAGMPTARALRSWLHDGKETIAGIEGEEGFGADVPINARLRMMIGQPGSSELLVGVLRQSKDRGGRNFPFSVFTHLPRRAFGKKYAMLPLGLTPLWESLDQAWQSLASVASKSAFDEVLEDLEAEQPTPLSEVVSEYKMGLGQSAEALSDRKDGASEKLLLSQMSEFLEQLKRNGDGLGLELPVRSGSEEACFDAAFWMDLLNHQFLMKRFEPSVMLDDAQPSGSRTVFLRFGGLDSDDYPTIMGYNDPETPISRPAHPLNGDPDEGQEDGEPSTYSDLLSKRLS